MIPVLITLVVVGVCIWLVNTYVPLPPPIKTVLTVVLVLGLCIWLLRIAGVLGGGGSLIQP
jgi:hypothetical protein